MTNGPAGGVRHGPFDGIPNGSTSLVYDSADASASPLSAALHYASHGLAVFPCIARSKEPAVRRGFYSATTNPAMIRRWFGGGHDYNVAVRTGLASGAWVLDIDEGGAESLRALEHQHGALPPTLTSRTAAARRTCASASRYRRSA